MWMKIIQILSNVSHPIPLAAVTVGVLAVLVYYRRKIPPRFFGTVILLILAADTTYVLLNPGPLRTYRVRLTILSPLGRPVDDASLVTTAGNETLRVPGGYQIEISADKKPSDGKVRFIATEPGTFYRGETTLVLGADGNPHATINLAAETESVTIAGIVEDSQRNGLAGVLVSVIGRPADEAVTTRAGGAFTLFAHASVGQQVMLHAEKKGYRTVDQWSQAGDDGTVLILTR
jgi:hypothetical protein